MVWWRIWSWRVRALRVWSCLCLTGLREAEGVAPHVTSIRVIVPLVQGGHACWDSVCRTVLDVPGVVAEVC